MGRLDEQILGHGGQLGIGLPVALPAVAGVAVPNQAHAAHVGAVENGAHAALIAASWLVLGAFSKALLLLAPAVSDQRGQHAVSHGGERRFVLEQQERAAWHRAARRCRRGRVHGCWVSAFAAFRSRRGRRRRPAGPVAVVAFWRVGSDRLSSVPQTSKSHNEQMKARDTGTQTSRQKKQGELASKQASTHAGTHASKRIHKRSRTSRRMLGCVFCTPSEVFHFLSLRSAVPRRRLNL